MIKKIIKVNLIITACTIGLFFLVIIGIGQLGSSQMTNQVFKASSSSYDDLTSEEAEALIDSSTELESAFAALEDTCPYTLDDLKQFLAAERATYGTTMVTGKKYQVSIDRYYSFKDGQGYSMDYKDVDIEDIGTYEAYEQREYEYEYRLPWQMFAAARYIFKNNKERSLLKSMQPEWTYAVPSWPYVHEIFDSTTVNIDGKDITMKTHQAVEDKTKYVPVTDDYEPKIGTKLTSDKYKNRVNGVEQIETIVEVETIKYKYKNGERKVKSRDFDKTEHKDITVELATPRPVSFETLFGTVTIEYEREQVKEERLSSKTKTKNYYYKISGKLKKKVITTTTSYLKSDKLVIKDVLFEADNSMYVEFFKKYRYEEKDAQYMMNLMSMLPGASEVSSLLAMSFEGNALYCRSDMSRTSYKYIKISPSELELDIPRFYQNDIRWAHLPFGDKTVGEAGCGPTSMAMVVTGLTGDVVTPPEVATMAAQAGYKSSKGLVWAFYSYAAQKFDLEFTELSPTAEGNEKMLKLLSQGHPVIVSVKKGHFTIYGHFIVLTYITKDGLIMVNDPYDPQHTKNRAWNPAIILDEANEYFIFGKRESDETDVESEEDAS